MAVLVALLVLLGGGAVAWATLAHRGDPAAAPGTQPGQAPQSTRVSAAQNDPSRKVPVSAAIASASASCVAGPSQDGSGTPVTYEPEKAVDGLLDTAWRCDGDGVGQRLEISFPGRVTLSGIGMIPGYAKTDSHDGTDRYAQNRRISAVHYAFDDGSVVTHNFETGSSDRSVQTLDLPGTATSHVTITVLSSVSGEAVGGQPASDRIAISEVTITTR